MKQKALAAVFTGNLIFGFSFIFSKLALAITTPFVLLAYRFIIAVVLLSLILLTGKIKVSFKGKNLKSVMLLGILQPVLYFVGENYGIVYSNATFSAVMIALIPICSTIFAAIFLRERATALQWFFSIASIIGVITMATQNSGEGGVKLIGVLLLILAVVSESWYMFLGRKISNEFSAFERTYSMMICGAITFTILALFENHSNMYALVEPISNPVFIICILYLAVLSSVVAFLFLNFATTHLEVARTVSFANITTVVSVFAGVIFIKEPCTPTSIVASIVIIVGVWGVQKFSKNQ